MSSNGHRWCRLKPSATPLCHSTYVSRAEGISGAHRDVSDDVMNPPAWRELNPTLVQSPAVCWPLDLIRASKPRTFGKVCSNSLNFHLLRERVRISINTQVFLLSTSLGVYWACLGASFEYVWCSRFVALMVIGWALPFIWRASTHTVW